MSTDTERTCSYLGSYREKLEKFGKNRRNKIGKETHFNNSLTLQLIGTRSRRADALFPFGLPPTWLPSRSNRCSGRKKTEIIENWLSLSIKQTDKMKFLQQTCENGGNFHVREVFNKNYTSERRSWAPATLVPPLSFNKCSIPLKGEEEKRKNGED